MNINENMTLAECLEYIRHELKHFDHPNLDTVGIKESLDRIHELTRWIPVEERLPTEQDADKHGFVLVRQVENESPYRVYTHMERWSLILEPDYFYTTTHWQRINTL